MNMQSIRGSSHTFVGSYHRLATLTFFIITLSLMVGCATQEPTEDKVEQESTEIGWPPPPQEPVIKYVRSVKKVLEAESIKKPKFMDIVAGAEDDEQETLRLIKPWGVSGDPSGRLLIADTGLGGLFVYNQETGKGEQWGDSGNGALQKPIDVTSDNNGHVYVTDIMAKRVVVFDDEGHFINTFGNAEIFENPVGIAVNDALGRVYVVDSKKHQVIVFNTQGDHLFTIGGGGGAPGEFYYPTAVAIGSEGRLFISDTMNFRVQILDADGGYIKSFGQLGDTPGSFSRPKGLALDADGHVYVADGAFSNIQIFDEDGQLLLAVGEGGVDPGQFQIPAGISIDQQGYIYVADQLNRRVQIFQYLGEPEPISNP